MKGKTLAPRTTCCKQRPRIIVSSFKFELGVELRPSSIIHVFEPSCIIDKLWSVLRFIPTGSTSSYKCIVSFDISTIAGPQEVNDKEETEDEVKASIPHWVRIRTRSRMRKCHYPPSLTMFLDQLM